MEEPEYPITNRTALDFARFSFLILCAHLKETGALDSKLLGKSLVKFALETDITLDPAAMTVLAAVGGNLERYPEGQ